MRKFKTLVLGLLCLFSTNSMAYIIREIPPESTQFITLENQPKDYDIFHPLQIEVSMFADFSDSVVGDFVFVIWDQADLLAAEKRLGKEFPEITDLRKYVFFGINQADKPIEYRPQVLGLLRQLHTLVNSDTSSKTAFNGVSKLIRTSKEVTIELDALKDIVANTKPPVAKRLPGDNR